MVESGWGEYMDKGDIRRIVREYRKTLEPEEAQGMSRCIVRGLETIDALTGAGVVMAYLALPGEVDVDPFITAALGRGVVVGVPVTDTANQSLSIARLESLDAASMTKGPMGIREPVAQGRVLLDPLSVDAVVVPGVAFDIRGGRMGYGGGFYDRLLPRMRPGTPLIGVAFDRQVFDSIPMEPHDSRMDVLVTPTRVLGFTVRGRG